MRRQNLTLDWSVFGTDLGWMAIAGRDDVLWQLSFGHDSPRAARDALSHANAALGQEGWNDPLRARLKAFAAGELADFSDVAVEIGSPTDFQLRVVEVCRAIDYGQTRSYGEVAALAGRPRAARAVGNVMAANRVPLVVPCHRVVAAGGQMGGYSAGEGVRLKLRLLEMESEPAVA